VQTSLTAVIEQSNTYRGNFETEPYEAAWALEARWFVNVLTLESGPIEFIPQISPDGLTWCDEGSSPLVIHVEGLQSLPLKGFGQWLRLRAVQPEHSSAKVLIYLALKG